VAKPNIILIVSDQHRGDYMGCAGNPVVSTPNLDALAEGGVMFTQNYCNSPLCVPSRMSMMTGRHPYHTGVFSNEDCLASDIPTFAHALGLGGYETVLCGRMHFVGPDQRHGYQQRLVGDITPSYSGGPKTDYGKLVGTPDSTMLSLELAGVGENPVLAYDEAVTSASEHYLDEASRVNRSKPLFLTVGLYGPHNPYTCPEEDYARALEAMVLHDKPIPADDAPHPWVQQTIQSSGLEALSEVKLRKARANYIGLVDRLDRYVGRIVRASQALKEDTILIYLSDHGDMAGDHGLFWKRSFFEGSARVPMIWHTVKSNGEALIARGVKMNVPTSLVDLAPTLVGISGSPEMPGLDGNDLSPLLQGPQSKEEAMRWYERPVFSELNIPGKAPARMIRFKSYKLVYYHGHPHSQLFDLEADPCELSDLGEYEAYDGIRKQLLDELTKSWDGEELLRSRNAKRPDLDYIKLWGQHVGMGRIDLWKYEDYLNKIIE
jgi:choline-sulfatase